MREKILVAGGTNSGKTLTDPGAPVPASEVRVYHVRKDGQQGRLLRTDPAGVYWETPKLWIRTKKKGEG